MKKFTILFSFLLLFTFFFVGSTYATENYPALPLGGITEENYLYIHFLDNIDGKQTLMAIASDNSLDNLKAYIYTDGLVRHDIPDGSTYKFYTYYLVDNVWMFDSVRDSSISNQYYGFTKIISSNFNIYQSKSSNEVFFSQTPLTTMEAILGEVPTMATKVVGTMKALLLCGVGCLALVISLPLFGKVFRIFQVK